MKLAAWIDRVDRFLVIPEKALLFVLFWTLIVVIAIQVVCRYWLFIATPWAEEVARFAFVWVVYLGASIATFQRDHITIDVAHPLYRYLFKIRDPRSIERFLIVVNFVVVVPFLAIFSYLNAGFLANIARLTQFSPAAGINMLIPMTAILAGSAMMLIHATADTLRGFVSPQVASEETLP